MAKRKTIPQLIKLADKEWSRYVRLRDSEYRDGAWIGQCITCIRPIRVLDADGHWNAGGNCGHFVGRNAKILRWDEENTNLQCAWCNAWRDKISMLDAYKTALDYKYGDGTAERLKRTGAQTHRPTREELEEIIHDSKEAVKFILDNK